MPPFVLGSLVAIALSVASPLSPKMWQLVRTKLASGLVSRLPPLRKTFLTCSSAASFVFFTTVLDVPVMVLSADCGGLTAGWRGWGGGNGVESGVGEGGGRAPAAGLCSGVGEGWG